MLHKYSVALVLLLVSISVSFCACEKKKEGKVIITEKEFVIRQDKDHSFVIDAKGKVRNVGEVDVKKVVVTGDCTSCSEVFTVGIWFVSGTDKTPEQKDIVSYISAGNEEEFSFKGIANIYNQPGEPQPEMPDGLEIFVESFETVAD
jgi:hypothetical protein